MVWAEEEWAGAWAGAWVEEIRLLEDEAQDLMKKVKQIEQRIGILNGANRGSPALEKLQGVLNNENSDTGLGK
jgi:hypothetical protein